MIKVYFQDSNLMPEVSSSSIQLAVISSVEAIWANEKGQVIIGLTQELVNLIIHNQPLTSIFNYPFSIWKVYENIIRETIRALKPTGFLCFNVGTPHGNSNIFAIAKHFRGVPILFPYITADIVLENTNLQLIADIIVNYDEKHEMNQTLTFSNYAEHFFVFSKGQKHKLRLKNILSVQARKPIIANGFKYTFKEDVIRYLIKKLSARNDWLLDPMAGSGKFASVAESLGRNTILYEINKDLRLLMEKTLKGCEVEWHENK